MKNFKYLMTRHSMAIISVLLGFLIVRVFGDATWFHDNAELMTMGLIKLGVWLSTFLLITKFGFPKLTIQDTIKNDPIAVAVLVGFVAVAVALVL